MQGAVRGQPGFREFFDMGIPLGIHLDDRGYPSQATSGIVHHKADGSVLVIPARPAPVRTSRPCRGRPNPRASPGM